MPQGGLLQGIPSGDAASARVIANGAPRCCPKSWPGGALKSFRFGARNELDDLRGAAGVGIEDLVDGIERRTAPVHPASGHRKKQAALRRGRRIETLVARGGEQFAAGRAIPERNEAEHIVRRNFLRHQNRHMGRKRLRRRQLLAVRAALRHRALLNRPDRIAGITVEHKDKTLLGRLDHDVAHALPGIDPRQRRLRRQVVIPDVVMHGLKRPHEFAGLGAQRDHGIGMLVVAGPLAAPEIRARRRRRQEYHAAVFVHRHRRPDIGMARDDAAMDQGIEAPARPPGPGIEGAHGTGRRLDAAIV